MYQRHESGPPGDRPTGSSTVLRQADPVSYFVVMRGHGPAWSPGRPMRKQDAWPAHAAFMDQLVSEAFVVLGGPISGDDSRIMLIVDCAQERDVGTRLADDPWTAAGLLRVTSVQAWQVLLKGDGAFGRSASPTTPCR